MAKKPARIDKRIDVILLDFDKNLGEKYDIVKVKPIFARNILFAQAKAVLANANNRYAYAKKIATAQQAKSLKTDEYKSFFEKLNQDNGISFTLKANEKGILYEKIDAAHIAQRINELYHIDLPLHLFKMKKKIVSVGEFSVPFVYRDLERDVTILVKAENDTASKKKTDTQESSQEEIE